MSKKKKHAESKQPPKDVKITRFVGDKFTIVVGPDGKLYSRRRIHREVTVW